MTDPLRKPLRLVQQQPQQPRLHKVDPDAWYPAADVCAWLNITRQTLHNSRAARRTDLPRMTVIRGKLHCSGRSWNEWLEHRP